MRYYIAAGKANPSWSKQMFVIGSYPDRDGAVERVEQLASAADVVTSELASALMRHAAYYDGGISALPYAIVGDDGDAFAAASTESEARYVLYRAIFRAGNPQLSSALDAIEEAAGFLTEMEHVSADAAALRVTHRLLEEIVTHGKNNAAARDAAHKALSALGELADLVDAS